jgi:hypothetical protein
VTFAFFSKSVTVTYRNPDGLDYGDYWIDRLEIGGRLIDAKQTAWMIRSSDLLDETTIVVHLGRKPK